MNGDSALKRILHIEEGQHYFLKPGDELPYKLLRNLGQGGCANVEEVEDQYTGRVFARKVFRIGGSSAERKRIFENEIRVVQRLAPHHHITRIFATYVGRREVGLLLTPVANRGSLDAFLQDAHEGLLTPAELDILNNSFGCLASGLEFMHAQRVRHKDIKPHNILVHNNSLIYTDFGSSLDYSANTRSITTGRPDSITRKYAAPEVHDWSPRSSKTDIFSLGCVYLEILSALFLGPLDVDMTPYRDHTEAILALMRTTSPSCDTWIRVVIETACQMLNIEPGARPPAEMITKELWMCWPNAFCDGCCMNLSAYAQAGDLSNSIFDSSTTQSSWYSQHIPVFDDMHNMQRSATDDVYESWMNSALHQQPSVLEVDQRPTNSVQQLSVGPYRPVVPSFYSEDFANPWKYSSASANERLEDGDLLSPTISLPNNSVSFSAWEPYNLGRPQPSSVQTEHYPSDVADSGRSPRRWVY